MIRQLLDVEELALKEGVSTWAVLQVLEAVLRKRGTIPWGIQELEALRSSKRAEREANDDLAVRPDSGRRGKNA